MSVESGLQFSFIFKKLETAICGCNPVVEYLYIPKSIDIYFIITKNKHKAFRKMPIKFKIIFLGW